MFGNMDFKRGLAGALGGQGGIQSYDAANARNALVSQRQGQIDAKAKQTQAKEIESILFDAAKYARQLPPESDRKLATKSYLQVRNMPVEAINRIEQAGYFQDLSDQKLDALIGSRRQEQVLKGNEVLLGANGQPIYQNRPNEVLADGAQLAGGDGSILADNPKDFAPAETPSAVLTDQYYAQNPEAFERAKALKVAGKSSTNVTVGDGAPKVGSIPKGYALYTNKDGSVEMKPVKGGPVEQAASEEQNRIFKQAQDSLGKLDRLIDGDLAGGVNSAYGWSGRFGGRRPGSKGRDAAAIIDEVIGPQVLDELAKMKGVPSDKDIELVKGAATALADPEISDKEARRQLKAMRTALKRIVELPDIGSQDGDKGNDLPPLPPGFELD